MLMLKRRASWLRLCCRVLLSAALSCFAACGEAGTKPALSNNNDNSGGQHSAVTRPPTEIHAPSTATAPLPAMTLLDDYRRDASAADRKYKGQTVVIAGEVAATGKSKAGVPFISFQKSGMVSPAGTMVVCNLTLNQEAAVGTLQKGSEVILSGRVQGTLTGNVLLENCVLQP